MFINGLEHWKDFNLWTVGNVLFYCIVDFWFNLYKREKKKTFLEYCEELKRQNENILISQICVFFNILLYFLNQTKKWIKIAWVLTSCVQSNILTPRVGKVKLK